MGKLKDDSNIQIYGWMATKLKLKGNELLIYAIIYSFSRNNKGEGVFNASIPYLQEWTNSTKRNIINCLNSLITKQLIIKTEDNSSKRKPNVYKINRKIFHQTGEESSLEQVYKVHQTGEESSLEQVYKVHQTGEESSPNNNIINTKDNTIINTNNIATATDKEKEEILKTYTDINPRFTSLEIQMLEEDIKIYPAKWIMEAMRRSVAQGKYKLSYIEGILNSWMANGYDEAGGKNGDGKQKGMVRQGQSVRRGRLYKQRKVETIEDVQAKFANETSGWD